MLSLHDYDCCTDSSDVDGDAHSYVLPKRRQMVNVFNEKHAKTYKARIIRIDKNQKKAKVHYIQYNKRYDEWVELKHVALPEAESEEMDQDEKNLVQHTVDAGCSNDKICEKTINSSLEKKMDEEQKHLNEVAALEVEKTRGKQESESVEIESAANFGSKEVAPAALEVEMICEVLESVEQVSSKNLRSVRELEATSSTGIEQILDNSGIAEQNRSKVASRDECEFSSQNADVDTASSPFEIFNVYDEQGKCLGKGSWVYNCSQ